MSDTEMNLGVFEPEIPVMFAGKMRKLRIDFNTMALIEERTGQDLLTIMKSLQAISTKTFISLIWACFVADDPQLTEKEVGRYMTFNSVKVLMEPIMRAMFICINGKEPTAEQLAQARGAGDQAAAKNPTLVEMSTPVEGITGGSITPDSGQ